MKTELYIENELVELDESVIFSITKEFSTLENPTLIVNDYTKEINVPFTVRNNNLFGKIFIPDSIRLDGDYTQMFEYFNPNKKMNFSLRYNGEELFTGYVKMTSIVKENNFGHYTIQLNGELGKVFQEMKKITFDKTLYETTEDIEKYYIDGYEYLDAVINRATVIDSFENAQDDYVLSPNVNAVNRTKTVSGKIVTESGSELTTFGMNYAIYDITNRTSIYIDKLQSGSLEGYARILFLKSPLINSSSLIKATLVLPANKTLTNFNVYPIPDGANFMVLNYYGTTPNVKTRTGVHNLIGFLPLNCFKNDFDYKSIEADDNIWEIDKYMDARSTNNYQIDNASILGDGFLPRTMNEFRSYHCQPYIYFNKFFELFLNQFKKIHPEYTFNLDGYWFQEFNDYYVKSCLLLNPLNTSETETSSKNVFITKKYIDTYTLNDVDYATSKNNVLRYTGDMTLVNDGYKLNLSSQGKWKLSSNLLFTFKFTSSEQFLQLNNNVGFIIDLNFRNEYGDVIEKLSYHIGNPSTPNVPPNTNFIEYQVNSRNGNYTFFWTLPISYYIESYKYNDMCYITVDSRMIGNSDIILNKDIGAVTATLECAESVVNLTGIEGKIGSDSRFTLNDMWNNKVTPFEIILNYCKMFGILIELDNDNKTINFIQRDKYFQNMEWENQTLQGIKVVDWTDKADYSNITTTPIINEHKYLKFNLGENDSMLNQNYLKKYGVQYGEIKVNTNYAFNQDEKELFTAPPPTLITYSPTLIIFDNILKGDLIPYFLNEVYLNCNDDENKAIDLFGGFIFRNGVILPDSTYPTIYISDDSERQKYFSKYCYTRSEEVITKIEHLPWVSINDVNSNCILFAKPKEKYSNDSDYFFKTGGGIYDLYWKDYIKEIYDNDNKKVTMNIKLNSKDFKDFSFSNFVKINNTLYHPTKIVEYNPESNGTTKVEFLTVKEIENYSVMPRDKRNENFIMDVPKEFIIETWTPDTVYTIDLIHNYDEENYTVTTDYPMVIDLEGTETSYSSEYQMNVTKVKFKLREPRFESDIVVKCFGKRYAECRVIYPAYDFVITPSVIEWPADGVERQVEVTIETNYIFNIYKSSQNINFILKPSSTVDNVYLLKDSSTTPTQKYIRFIINADKSYYLYINYV